MRRVPTTVAIACALVVAWTVGALEARAQLPPPPTLPTTSTTSSPGSTTSSTTSTTAPPPTTPTTAPPGPGPSPTSSSTTAPPEASSTTSSTSPFVTGGPDAVPPGTAPQAVPPQYAAYMNSVHRSSPNGTATLLAALQPLEDLGLTRDEAIAAAFGHFPVAGVTTFTDDWWYPRYNQPFHLHQGTDIFADLGTPVRAPADGTLRHSVGGLGGLADYVTQADGTYYFMGHLSAFVDGQPDGLVVKQGDVIGYVGNTGDAAGGPTHVHFEVHMDPWANPYLRPPPPPPPPPPPASGRRGRSAPTTTTTTAAPRSGARSRGRVTTTTVPPPVIVGDIHDPVLYGSGKLPATDPKPFLDQWLQEDLVNLPAVIARFEAGKPRAIIDTGLTRRFADGRAGEFSAPSGPPRAQLLWATSASPEGGALRLAEAEASAAVTELDYETLVRAESVRLVEWQQADDRVRALLAPITPAAVRRYLGGAQTSS